MYIINHPGQCGVVVESSVLVSLPFCSEFWSLVESQRRHAEASAWPSGRLRGASDGAGGCAFRRVISLAGELTGRSRFF